MKQEKQLLLDEVKGQIERFGSFLVVQKQALGANAAHEFRGQILENGGDVEVVRKRIFIKAAAEAGVQLTLEQLPGQIAIVFAGEDPVATAKDVFKFQKETGGFEVISARIDGVRYSKQEVESLSKLPGRDGLRAQLLGLLEAPMSQLVGTVNALLCSVMYCLEQKTEKEQVK